VSTLAEDAAPEQSADSSTSDKFQTGQVLTVVTGHFTHDTSSAFFAPLLPLLQEKLSLSYGLVGTLGMLLQLPGLLTPFIGYLADRISVRYFIIFAPAVTATLMSLIGQASNYLSLALMLVGVGISTASFHAPAPAMVANVSGARLGTGMGLFMAGGELGRTLGPLVVAASVAWFGLEGMWRLMFVGWAVSGFLYWRLRNIKVQPRVARGFPWRQGVRVFSVLGWLLLTRAFFVGAISTFLPTYMDDVVGSSFLLAAGALTILEAAGVAGVLLSGVLSDRFGRRGILLFLLSVAPLILFAFLQSPPWGYVPLLLLLGFTAFSATPIFLAIVQEQFPNDRALANGIFMSINFLALGIGVSLTGIFADQIGLRAAFVLTGFIAFLSLPSVFFLPKSG